MTKKLRCTVTGNIHYFTEKRYNRLLSKYGDEDTLRMNFVSLVGKKVMDGRIDMPEVLKNRIKCRITGKWHFISDNRIKVGLMKYGSWDTLSTNYISREAARLLREGKTEDEIRTLSALNLLED